MCANKLMSQGALKCTWAQVHRQPSPGTEGQGEAAKHVQ